MTRVVPDGATGAVAGLVAIAVLMAMVMGSSPDPARDTAPESAIVVVPGRTEPIRAVPVALPAIAEVPDIAPDDDPVELAPLAETRDADPYRLADVDLSEEPDAASAP